MSALAVGRNQSNQLSHLKRIKGKTMRHIEGSSDVTSTCRDKYDSCVEDFIFLFMMVNWEQFKMITVKLASYTTETDCTHLHAQEEPIVGA